MSSEMIEFQDANGEKYTARVLEKWWNPALQRNEGCVVVDGENVLVRHEIIERDNKRMAVWQSVNLERLLMDWERIATMSNEWPYTHVKKACKLIRSYMWIYKKDQASSLYVLALRMMEVAGNEHSRAKEEDAIHEAELCLSLMVLATQEIRALYGPFSRQQMEAGERAMRFAKDFGKATKGDAEAQKRVDNLFK